FSCSGSSSTCTSSRWSSSPVPAPFRRLVVAERGECAACTEVGEGPLRAGLEQRLEGDAAGADADALSRDGARGVDVTHRVADHHDTAVGNRGAELVGAALGPDAQQRGAIFVVAAEAAEVEAAPQIAAPELDRRAGTQVAGAEAHRAARPGP